jgi:hypothetical protein
MDHHVPGRGFIPQSTLPTGKPVRGLRKVKNKPEYAEVYVGMKAPKKPARKKKAGRRKSAPRKITTANTKSVARPKKRLPQMKKSWWQFW